MVDGPTLALGIENSSSIAWSAPERFQEELGALSRAAQQHLYLVVLGPKLIATDLQPLAQGNGWKLEITYGTGNSETSPYTIQVPDTAFPNFRLSFDAEKRVLTLVPSRGNDEQRKVTVAEVVRATIKAGLEEQAWIDSTVDKLFSFEVAYIGQSYGRIKRKMAIDRLIEGHETVDKILSDVQSYSHNREVAFVTIDQQLTSVDAHMHTGPSGTNIAATIKAMAQVFGAEHISKMVVDAAEAALITAFQPKWNKKLRDFTQKEAQELVGKLKEGGYTHLRIRINLRESLGKVKGPVKGVPSEFHSWAFNLDTGAIELPGAGPLQWSLTNY